jgi:NAD(P)-dependent dehydrogenase (short-subunit alcohol dehydrogenase family)
MQAAMNGRKERQTLKREGAEHRGRPRPISRNLSQRESRGKMNRATGGTKGIGEVIVGRITRGGVTVIRLRGPFPPTRIDPTGSCGRVSAQPMVRSELSRPCLEHRGGLHILVNTVGGSSSQGGGALALGDDHWQPTFNANLFPAVHLDRGLLRSTLKQGSGVILHIMHPATSGNRPVPQKSGTTGWQPSVWSPCPGQNFGTCSTPAIRIGCTRSTATETNCSAETRPAVFTHCFTAP